VNDHSRWQDDLAAYLLGSLEPREAEQFERHLDGCEECRERRSWLEPALQTLPESVERIEPPPELRERVLAEVRSDAARRSGEARRPAPRRWLLRPAIGLAALALLGAALAGYALNREGDDATTTPVVQGDGVTARLERKGDSGTLEMASVERLPAGQIYQAWVQNGDQIRPSSLFDARADGTASAAIPHGLDRADAVMVTIEPRGGSDEPSSRALVSVPLED
jgi:anti-sigma-K factor RskA